MTIFCGELANWLKGIITFTYIQSEKTLFKFDLQIYMEISFSKKVHYKDMCTELKKELK